MKIGIIIVAIVIIGIVIAYNRLVKLRNDVKNSGSGINVYLQQRFDLIPNLIEVVKGYVQHEKELLAEITRLRTDAKTDIKAANELNIKFSELYAVAENYPELKASEQFLNLQQNLSKMENQLQAARRSYNMDVTELNTAIDIFPLSVIAAMFGIRKADLFQSDDIKGNITVMFEK